jgi:hypothetical protein
MTRFGFAFATPYLATTLPFGITPKTAWVDVSDDELDVRFGLLHLRTPRSNVKDVRITRDYLFVKAAGPARLSLADRGLTFATNGRAGVCVCFHEPVAVLPGLTHPGLTVTVADVDGLAAVLRD